MLLEQVFDVPLGVRLLNKIPVIRNMSFSTKNYCHQFNILLLTFLSYSSYHLARKPTSVVKNVLHHKNCSDLIPPADLNITDENVNTWCNWSPFDGHDADTLLGALDSAFLFAYAIGMYFTGPLAERINIRYFLSFGMILSGIFGFLFGMAYWTSIHSLAFFIIIQILAGFCQSTGWPGCVAAVGNWFGKNKRGLIMGIWRSHHSVGNIFGTLIAAAFVEYNWGLSFAVPAVLIGGLGVLLFLFLVPDPRAVGCTVPDHTGQGTPDSQIALSQANSELSLSVVGVNMTGDEKMFDGQIVKANTTKADKEKAIGFLEALRIPGVIEFSLCLFFTKLINYTFLYWLPRYIKESGLNLGDKASGDLSTLFDVGGIFGGILAGLISDMTGMSAVTCAGALILSFPMLFVYQAYGSISIESNIGLLFIVGLLVNGPYALITTAVSADLGTHPELKGSSRALATVTAIIDGTGSIGAAIGPLMAGPISNLGWDYVFYALMIASALALILLTRLVINEIKEACRRKNSTDNNDLNQRNRV